MSTISFFLYKSLYALTHFKDKICDSFTIYVSLLSDEILYIISLPRASVKTSRGVESSPINLSPILIS